MDTHKFLTVSRQLLLAAVCVLLGIAQGRTQAATVRDVNSIIQKKMNRVTQAERQAAADRQAAAHAGVAPQSEQVSPLAAPMPGVGTMSMPMPDAGGMPHYFGPYPNWAYSPPLRKFVDSLPGLTVAGINNLGQYIPVAVADVNIYPGSDYYEIGLVQYTEQMHSDLPPTTLRGYVQLNDPNNPATRDANGTIIAWPQPHYLGPLILAQKDRPVRFKFTNLLPTGAGGDLFIPVDTTEMGAGMGPLGMGVTPGNQMDYTQNRGTLHLHGGRTPWISDGTPHQWITPAGENTDYPKGVSAQNVPDMPDPGDGSMTFFYSNQQSARLMFYHDHVYGITRLNVYAGEAAGYLITDQTEQELVTSGLIPAEQIPLIIQDRTFVDANTIGATDPTWNWGSMPGMAMTGDLWFPHVYMPNQNPYDLGGANPFGRWDYGPWFWPPWPTTIGEVPNPYYDTVNAPWEPPTIPGVPNVSMTMEAFHDTPIINGTAYPYLDVQPKAYRFRILNAANDRFWNLLLVQADPASAGLTEVKMVPFYPGTWPAGWGTPDAREGGVPDPTLLGPNIIQIGNEGGFLPAPVVWSNIPVDYEYDRRNIVVLNVKEHNLFLGCAERADVIIDFSAFAGKTLILYNDSPAPVPAADPRLDYYTGHPDMTATGGNATTLPGYGSNTRTIMQIRVANTIPAPAFDVNALNAAFASTATTQGVFAASQDPIIVPQAGYNSAYNATFPAGTTAYERIQSLSLTFNPLDLTEPNKLSTTSLTIMNNPKAIAEEFENEYGRMSGFLGVEVPFTNGMNQTTIFYGYIDPATEDINDCVATGVVTAGDGTQIWKITHNGVDTHPIHFHLFDVQLINRVGWDGAVRPPDRNELGWKETLRMNPLEDCIVALRPVAPKQPFGIPDSNRPLNPTMPLGDTMGFKNVDPLGNPITVTNVMTNFGWEYMWHCHILSHEEMDMMRPVVFNVARALPDAPVLNAALSGAAIGLTWTDATPPSNPSTWGNPSNEIGFRIERATGDGAFAAIGTALANAAVYTDTTVVIGTTYSYRVVAFNAAGESLSNIATIAFLTVPGAPTNVIATAGNAQATVSFTAPASDGGSSITGYTVTSSPGGITATGTSSPITVTGLTNGIAYTFTVTATNAVGTGPASGPSNSVTPAVPLPLPAAPTNLTATPSNPGVAPISVALRWRDKSGNEVGFLIERATGTGAFTQVGQVGANVVTWTDVTVAPATAYRYQVRAFNVVGYSGYSNTANVTTPSNALPNAPSNVRISQTGNNYLNVAWNDNSSNETGFQIQRSTTETGPWATITTTGVNTTSYRDNGLGRRTTWYYQVRSINGFGNSAWIPVTPISGTTR